MKYYSAKSQGELLPGLSGLSTAERNPGMVEKDEPGIQYKHLTLFFIAACSLLLSGVILNEKWDWIGLCVSLWCSLCGIFLIYRINDYIDQKSGHQFLVREFLSKRWHILFVFQLFLVTIPVSFFTLSLFRFIALGLIALTGTLYSVSFRIGDRRFRLKNIFLFKNISIGAAWGTLVLIGADAIRSKEVFSLFVFSSIQVLIGSMIRDLPDVEKDKLQGVKTFPVLFGIGKTIMFMHIVNFISVLSGAIAGWSVSILSIILPTVSWRLINLWNLKRHADSRQWVQNINLLTCAVILLFVLVEFLENYFGKH